MRRIVEHVDGVPLFAEELAKTASSDNEAHIPATLQDLLAVRIDAMGEAKAAAQMAATLGREFDLAVLRRVLHKGSEALAEALNALQDAQLLARRGESVCQFKHALIQQAVYESQTHSARKVAHQRIAQVLLADFPDVVRTQPESLARHLSLGGEIQQSIDYWIKAGQRAALRSAHAEAMVHCQAGLRLLTTLPTTAERNQLECALRMSLGAALIATQGYGSMDAGSEYTRAAELAVDPKNASVRFTAMWGMWLGSSSRIDHGHSLELAEKLLQLGKGTGMHFCFRRRTTPWETACFGRVS
jgi:predicted ATPase